MLVKVTQLVSGRAPKVHSLNHSATLPPELKRTRNGRRDQRGKPKDLETLVRTWNQPDLCASPSASCPAMPDSLASFVGRC